MDSAELLDQVRQLRGAGKSPKQIARALGMPPSAIAPLVRTIAAERTTAVEAELAGCWISSGWSLGLSVDESRGWTDNVPSGDGVGGVVSVLIPREPPLRQL